MHLLERHRMLLNTLSRYTDEIATFRTCNITSRLHTLPRHYFGFRFIYFLAICSVVMWIDFRFLDQLPFVSSKYDDDCETIIILFLVTRQN